MVTIKNEYLEAQFDPKGAEISKIIGMQDQLYVEAGSLFMGT